MIPLTDRLLADAGGWQAMKEARGLLAAGRVTEATYTPPLLTGRVRGAETEFRSGLKINSKSDIENTCTCMESRRWGRICAHSLAVGLGVIHGLPQAAPPPAPPAPQPEKPRIFSTTDGELCALHFILPPNFAAAWEKGTLMLVIEVERGGERRPFATLDVSRRHRVDAADAAVADALLALAGGKPAAMLMLKREQFTALLAKLAGHPRVTFGKGARATFGVPVRPNLSVERTPESVRLSASVAGAYAAGGAAWVLEKTEFRAVAPGLPAAYLRLLTEAVTIPADAAEPFLQKELPVLAQFFDVAGEVAAPEPESLPEPEFFARFEGSLNFLSARLDAVYGERRVTLDATGAALARFARNRAAEAGAVARLNGCGFAGPDSRGEFSMKGERVILSFFAAALPRLQREWRVEIGERFEHVTKDIERIEPRVEIVSSGEQWFDLRYDLATTGGGRFSGTEIAQLLQAGQSHVKRGGKTAVFDPALLDDFSQLLRDAAPRQLTPGVYRMDRSHAGTLDVFTAENGVAVAGSPRWREWATATRQLEKLAPVPLGALEGVLRPYQKHGVAWLHFLAQNGLAGILADEMGLGKTLQALAFLQTLRGRGPAIVVCPSSLVFNWCAEAARWTPQLRVLRLDGPRRDHSLIASADLVVTSYPLLRRDAEKFRGAEFTAALLDEAQHIKNPDSQNAQSAQTLRARHRFVLTGTPMENSVRDVWSLMNFLMPGYLGSRDDFRERYEKPIQQDAAGPESARLRRRLQPFLLRRTKKTAAADLPEKIEQLALCELTATQRELYEKLAVSTRTQLSELAAEKDRGKARMVMLTALLRLRQAACDVRLTGLEATAEEASEKLELLAELLGEAMDGGHRVLVFSQFVTMLGFIRERLNADGIGYCYLDGSTKDRQGEVARFQKGDVPVFLISLKAGGTGLNLTAADTVIHFDPWWNPAVEAQATDRAHRIGQRSVVTSYKLIARGTVEEKIVALQAKKRAAIEAAIESEQPLMEGLTMGDIEGLLE